MRRALRISVLLLAGVSVLPWAGGAQAGPNRFGEQMEFGQPVRFTDSAGHVYQPRRLVLLTHKGALVAKLPETALDTYSEDRLDFSGTPVLGRYFHERLTPADAARQGLPVGPIYRDGATLIVDARASGIATPGRGLVLTANFPRGGATSYRFGPLGFVPVAAPAPGGTGAGAAYLVGDNLVLAGTGWEPLITDWGKLGSSRP